MQQIEEHATIVAAFAEPIISVGFLRFLIPVRSDYRITCSVPSRLVSQAAISSLPLVAISGFKSIREGLKATCISSRYILSMAAYLKL